MVSKLYPYQLDFDSHPVLSVYAVQWWDIAMARGTLPGRTSTNLKNVGEAAPMSSDDMTAARCPRTGRRGLGDWQANRVIAYIDSHIAETIRIEELAAQVKLSAGHFARAFAIRFAMSPYAFVMKRRVEHAQHLMIVSDAHLSAIASDCGLADQAHLTRLFKRFEGKTPTRWRREATSVTQAAGRTS